MAFDLKAAKAGLLALLGTLPFTYTILNGSPKVLTTDMIVWVTVGDLQQVAAAAAGGLYEVTMNMSIGLGYEVDGAPADAEDQLADTITAIINAVITNRFETVGGVTRMLNGSVHRMDLPQSTGIPGNYVTMAGQEARMYFLIVPVVQRNTIGG